MDSTIPRLVMAGVALVGLHWHFPVRAQMPPAAMSAVPKGKSLVDLAESLLADALPREYERKKDWGSTKLVTRGIKFERDGLRLETRRRKVAVNHGLWQHYRVDVKPGQRLDLDIQRVRQDAKGKVSFQLVATAPVQGFANFMDWHEGLRLFSVRGDCEATVRLTLDAEAALAVNGGVIVPTVAVEPRVTRARLELLDFRLKRFGDIEGRLAKRLGDLARDEIQDQLHKQEDRLVAKINKSLDKHRADLKVSGDEFLREQWEKVRKMLENARLKDPTK